MNNERAEFSKRLAEAMRAMGHEARPSVLCMQFNARYDGTPVRFQTAWRWLHGKSLPEQDKLVVLAQLLRTDPQTLRFGTEQRQAHALRMMWPDRVTPRDQVLFEDFLALPVKQRDVVRGLIEALATVQQEK